MATFYDCLSHGGPGSGRYPWGSGARPYQRLEQPKRKSGVSDYFQQRKARKYEAKQNKLREEAKARAEAEEERKRKLLADKERVLRSGSASEVLKYQGMLTNQELQNAWNRIDLERKLSSFSASEIQTNMQKIDKYMQNLKTINNWGSIATDTWNLLAAAYNSTEEGKKKPMSLIKRDGGGDGKKKK